MISITTFGAWADEHSVDRCLSNATRSYYDRREANERAFGQFRDQLRDEFMAAVLKDPRIVISTPGYLRTKQSPVCQIVAEDIDTDQCVDLLNFLAAAARGEPVQDKAAQLLNAFAAKHAQWQADNCDDECWAD